MPPLAHAGHWAQNLLVTLPLVVFGLWVGAMALRERLRRRDAAEQSLEE